MTRRAPAYRVAVAAILLMLLLVGAVYLIVRDSPYTVKAEFANAGGLVEGGVVQVAGRKVGSISKIGVSAGGNALVTLDLDDDAVTPLRDGTRATIRSLGQAGITNRFVDLSLGAQGASALGDGSTIGINRTTSVVALDSILNSFGPRERENLRRLIGSSADIFAGSGAPRFNSMLAELDPTMAELNGLVGEISRDRASIARVIDRGAVTATALASRREDLRSAIANSAAALEALEAERGALGGTLQKAPAALAQAGTTLRSARTAVLALRPALRDVPATARPLETFLDRSSAVLPRATPVVRDLTATLPDLRKTLDGMRPLRAPAVGALRSASKALLDSRPILRGARLYGSDFVLGILNGLVGAGSYNYTRFGHYQRLDFIQPPQSSISGFGSTLLQGFEPLPGVIALRTGLTRRCPGGNVPPAIDGSTPIKAEEAICTPGHNTPASVNDP